MNENTPVDPKEVLIHEVEEKPQNNNMIKKVLIIGVIVAIGTATGYFLSSSSLSQVTTSDKAMHTVVKTDKGVGSTDTQTFKDTAEGKLEKGGIDGEGTHKLIRDPKRPDQNVYLTSSVVDLDQYVGKKVKVWGETFSAQKAGWLMDVGKIETQ